MTTFQFSTFCRMLHEKDRHLVVAFYPTRCIVDDSSCTVTLYNEIDFNFLIIKSLRRTIAPCDCYSNWCVILGMVDRFMYLYGNTSTYTCAYILYNFSFPTFLHRHHQSSSFFLFLIFIEKL